MASITNISPPNLRARNVNQNTRLSNHKVLNTQSKKQTDLQSKPISKSKVNSDSLAVKAMTGNPHDTSKVYPRRDSVCYEGKFLKIEADIKSIRETINRNHENTTSSINSVQNEIKEKSGKYDVIIQEMNANIYKMSLKTMPLATCNISDKYSNYKIDFAIHYLARTIDNIDLLKTNINANLSEIYNAIKNIEDKNVATDNMIANLVESMETSVTINHQRETQPVTTNKDNIESIINEIECLQYETKKHNLLIMQDEEKLIVMNRQIHVLSAKYVQFNDIIKNLLLDLNRAMSTKIQQDNVVDIDAVPFMVSQAACCTTNNENVLNANLHDDVVADDPSSFIEIRTNIDANNKSAGWDASTDRFGKIYNKFGYSKLIRVRIENANIVDIGLFTEQLKSRFIHTIGSKTVDKVTVTRYTKANTIVNSMDVIVSFSVPIGYQYLSTFKFPNNWIFFEFNTGNRMGNRSFPHNIMRRKRHN